MEILIGCRTIYKALTLKFGEISDIIFSADERKQEYRSVAQFGRAAVSKTAGRGFDSCHSCHHKGRGGETW